VVEGCGFECPDFATVFSIAVSFPFLPHLEVSVAAWSETFTSYIGSAPGSRHLFRFSVCPICIHFPRRTRFNVNLLAPSAPAVVALKILSFARLFPFESNQRSPTRTLPTTFYLLIYKVSGFVCSSRFVSLG
jgi:hypothetical protein